MNINSLKCNKFNLIKLVLVIVILAITSVAVVLQLLNFDFYCVPFDQKNLAPSKQVENYLEENPKYSLQDVLEGNSSFSGVRLNFTDFALYPSDYVIVLRYTYTGPDGYVNLRDMTTLNNDNTATNVFFNFPLVSGEPQDVTIPITNDSFRSLVSLEVDIPSNSTIELSGRIQTTSPYFTDRYAILLFLFLISASCLLICKYSKSNKKTQQILVALSICFLFATAATLPFFQHGFAKADSLFHYGRIEAISLAIKNLELPMVLSSYAHNGWGYPDPVYYPNLFLYFPAILRLLNISPMLAYKTLALAINFFTAVLAYIPAYKFSKSRKIAIIFAAIYTFGLYRLTNIIQRGAIGEALGMIFIPLAIYGIHSIFYSEKKEWLLLSLAMCGIVNSHVLSILLVGIFLVIYCILNFKKLFQKAVIIPCIKAATLCASLCFGFLLPFLIWLKFPVISASSHIYLYLTNQAAQPAQMFSTFLFTPNAMSIDLTHGVYNEMPLSVGIFLGFGALIYLFVRYYLYSEKFIENKSLKALGDFSLTSSIISLIASSSIFPYFPLSYLGKLNILGPIQFPWRFLGIATVCLSILTTIGIAMLIKNLSKLIRSIVAFFIILLSFLAIFPFFDSYINLTPPTHFVSSTLSCFESDDIYFTSQSAYTALSKPTLYCEDKTFSFSECKREPLKVSFSFSNPSGDAQTVRVPLYGFANSQASLSNGVTLETSIGENSEFILHIPKGINSGDVVANFYTPWYFYLSYAISVITFIGLIVFIILKSKRNKLSNT